VIQVFETPEFTGWLASLRDDNAHARIVRCIRRMEGGNFGDFKPAGGHGVMETRIDYGPGYRVYYVRRGATVVILLCGGDKRTQQKDIKEAQKLADSWKDVPS
jgi:putative addiction module killer protein